MIKDKRGGKRAIDKIIPRLKGYKNATINHSKLKNYLLNRTKRPERAKYFNSLGYTMKNYAMLERDIRNGLANNKAVRYVTDNKGNTAYSVEMEIGITKKSTVLTAWVTDKDNKYPRFVTAYKGVKK